MGGGIGIGKRDREDKKINREERQEGETGRRDRKERQEGETGRRDREEVYVHQLSV